MDKILVIQTAFIGDAILTLPMIQKLKEQNDTCEIHVLAIPSTHEIFSASSYVDRVLVIDKKNKHKSLFGLLRFVKEIKVNNYAKIYSPHRSLRTSFIVLSLGVKETYGFSNSSLKHVYRHIINYEPGHHEVQRNLELIGYTNKNNDWKILPEIRSDKEIIEKIDRYFSDNKINSKIAAVAPGSVWNTKIYPQEYYREIINFLKDKGYYIFIIGGEKDKELCADLINNIPGSTASVAGMFSLTETIELLKRAEILISNDSAPTHMGVSAHIPVLTIYCSTVSSFGFYPYNSKSSFLSFDDLPCKPCGIHGHKECPVKTFDCGYKLKPQIVISKIEEMLNDKN